MVMADKVSRSGGVGKGLGGDVLFAGEVPGIGTKVNKRGKFLTQ